jgi:hypothetical protein
MSVTRLYIVDDRMIHEYGAVGGMRIGRGIDFLKNNII